MAPDVVLLEGRAGLRASLVAALQSAGYHVLPCGADGKAGSAPVSAGVICLGDSGAGAREAIEALPDIRRWACGIPIVLWLSERSEELVLAALRAGAADFFRIDEPLANLIAALRTLMPAAQSPNTPDSLLPDSLERIVGHSPGIRRLRSHLPRFAASECNVLITGETGTGKDLVAELIHRNSRRARGPFVCINCAAFPDSLLESELFGHDRGAFTGASAARQGRLEAANRGTIFLDEIGEMSACAQAKILRAIEAREVQRLGSNGNIPLDVRIVAATNQNLSRMVADRTFRNDLFFRLNVARVDLPPLRERKEDIPLLISWCVRELNRRSGKSVDGPTEAALQKLMRHDWPGNVRELKNLVEAIFIAPPASRIDLRDLPAWFDPVEMPSSAPRGDRELLIEVLRSERWNKSKAAERLKWSRMTLYRKMAKFGIDEDGELEKLAAAV